MPAPTLGRIVHYYPCADDLSQGRCVRPGEPAPAIIVNVWGPTCLNLTVFDKNGVPFPATSVVFAGDLPEAPQERHAYWPPREGIPAAWPADPADRGEAG